MASATIFPSGSNPSGVCRCSASNCNFRSRVRRSMIEPLPILPIMDLLPFILGIDQQQLQRHGQADRLPVQLGERKHIFQHVQKLSRRYDATPQKLIRIRREPPGDRAAGRHGLDGPHPDRQLVPIQSYANRRSPQLLDLQPKKVGLTSAVRVDTTCGRVSFFSASFHAVLPWRWRAAAYHDTTNTCIKSITRTVPRL